MGLWAYFIFIGIAVCAGASFFFALAETSLFALGKFQVRQLVERGAPEGVVIARLLERPVDLLATIVLGNTLANAGLVALALVPVLQGHWSTGTTLLVLFFVILFGCEVLPKTLAVRAPERWATWIASPILWLEKGTRSIQSVFQAINHRILAFIVPRSIQPQNTLSDADYHELVEMAYAQGALKQREKEIILQIIGLDRKTAGDVMRPRTGMAAIPDDLSVEEMVAAAQRFKRRRLPLYDKTPDTVVGILDTQKLLMDPGCDLADAIEFPSFVPQSMNLLKLLQSLQRQQRGLAVVLDEFGGTAGVVRLEDILSEVVGQIRDEGEAEGFIAEKLGRGRWRVNGTMRLDDFRREYPDLGEVEDVDTIGGLVVRLMEVVPVVGQSVRFRGLKLTVQQADERRVREVLVEEVRK